MKQDLYKNQSTSKNQTRPGNSTTMKPQHSVNSECWQAYQKDLYQAYLQLLICSRS